MTTTAVEEYLQAYRECYGEEAWRDEVKRLALAALRTKSEKLETYWCALAADLEWLDWEALKAQAESSSAPPSTDRLIAETIKSQMPGLRTQAQYDAVASTMGVVQQVVNAILDGNTKLEQDARSALEIAFENIGKATELSRKLEDVPEAASSDASKQFKDPPAQFHEVDAQAELLQELALLPSLDALKAWYDLPANRSRRDKVITQALRNELLDAIRAKRKTLS
jgi:hypothetical protein